MPTIKTTIRMFEFIRRVIVSTGEAPTLQEIADFFGMRSLASVHEQLEKMEDRGMIKRSRRWRGIQIVSQGQDQKAA